MARVKSLSAVKTPSQLGGGASTLETQRRCAWTGKEVVTAEVGVQGLQKKMKKQYRQPLLFQLGSGTELVILFAPFARLVREITEFHSREVTRWTPDAVLSLHYASEFVLEEMFRMENPLTIHLECVAINQEQEQPSRARKEGLQDLAQRIVTEPAGTVTPATTRRRWHSVGTPAKLTEESSWGGRENSVSKAQNTVVMGVPAAASATAKRRLRRNVEAPAEGPGIHQLAKRARRPCSRYPASDWAL